MLAVTQFNSTDYSSLRFALILQFESSGSIELTPYIDTPSAGIATIGIGFNIETNSDNLSAVMDFFGIASNEYTVRSNIAHAIANASSTANLVSSLNSIMASRAAALGGRSTFAFQNGGEATTVFNGIIGGYETQVDQRIAGVVDSRERAVLVDLAYNLPDLVGAHLVSAIQNGDRAAAFFEIRYESDGGGDHLAKRRYIESQIFGLYSDITPTSATVTQAEAFNALRMLTTHEQKIDTYDAANAARFALAAGDFAAIENRSQDFGQMQTTEELLAIARQKIVHDYADLGVLAPALRAALVRYGISTALLSGNIGQVWVASETAGGAGEVAARTVDRSAASAANDLIFGTRTAANTDPGTHDTLSGGAGNDFFVGGLGADLIDGGAGEDTASYLQSGGSVEVHLDGASGVGAGAQGDQLTGIENLFGSNYADALYGNASNNILYGSGGDDSLSGGSGSDRLFGGAGLDTLQGGDGDDELDGGDDSAADSLSGGAGADTFAFRGGDIVADADLKDRIKVDGQYFLTGGHQIKDSNGNFTGKYEGAHGETYSHAGTSLAITMPGGATMSVANWSAGKAGISFVDPPAQYDPIVLDLDGDGIELSSYAASSTYFDLDSDGFAERTAWIGGGDGLLVMDQDADGLIADGDDLFTFASLAFLDTNADGVVDAADQAFSSLLIWRDINGDGKADVDELQSLSEAGIVGVSLSHDLSSGQEIAGNRLLETGTFERLDGSTGIAAAVAFVYSNHDTVALNAPPEDPSVANLPRLRGDGEVFDLSIAMSVDPDLKALVEQFSGISLPEAYKLTGLAEAILLRWYGADAIAHGDPEAFVDARYRAVIDKLWAGMLTDHNGNMNGALGSGFTEAWQVLRSTALTALIAQTPLGQELFPGISAEMGAFVTLPPASSLEDTLAHLSASSPSSAVQRLAYWNAMVQILSRVRGEFAENDAAFASAVDAALANQGLPVSHAILRDALAGTAQSEVIYGRYVGHDGISSDDLIIGAGGDDTLKGGTGSDTYIFFAGDGHDRVVESRNAGVLTAPTDGSTGLDDPKWFGEDRLVFLGTISENDVVFSRQSGSGDLLITNTVTGDTVTVEGQFVPSNTAIEFFEFADGTELAWSEVSATWFPSDAGDNYVPGSNARDDLLDGGAGNDLLEGGAGDDTYVFGHGYGADHVIDARLNYEEQQGNRYEVDGSHDRILFAPDVDPSDVIAQKTNDGSGLILILKDTGERLLVQEQFGSSPRQIESFEFDDGTEWSHEQVEAMTLASTDYNDYLRGSPGADVLAGGVGNDRLEGGGGSDTYIFGAGDGLDRILDDAGDGGSDHDVVEFGTGVNSSNLNISRSGDDLVLTRDGTSDGLTIEKYFHATSRYGEGGAIEIAAPFRVEELRFADGATLTHAAIMDAVLAGTAVGDALRGDEGANTLDGGAGDDRLEGGYGDDAYVFDRDYGVDTISNRTDMPTDFDRVVFGSTIAPNDLQVRASATGDLVLSLNGADDQLIVENYFTDSAYRVAQFDFADGNHWTATDIYAALSPTTGDDIIFGDLISATGDSLSGSDGDDRLVGQWGDDVLDGGAGNDLLDGGGGADVLDGGPGDDQLVGGHDQSFVFGEPIQGDTFRFGRGYGHDAVVDGSPYDNVQLGDSIVFNDLEFARIGANLRISIAGTQDDLTLHNYFSSALSRVGGIKFADGSMLSPADVFATFLVTTSGDDHLVGDFTDNILAGGPGSDLLEGRAGNDTYLFSLGDGADTIIESGGFDTIVFGAGIAPEDLAVRFDSARLVIEVGGGSDSVTLQSTYPWGGFQSTVRQFVFADGVKWSLDTLIAHIAATEGDDLFLGGGGGSINQFHGLGGDDYLNGGSGTSLLYGDAGDDTLISGNGDDYLDGGTGDDYLSGGYSNDTYFFGVGYGADVISDPAGHDTIKMDDAINPSDVEVTKMGADLVLTISGTTDSLTLQDFFSQPDRPIDEIQFASSVTWQAADIWAALAATADDDDITGPNNGAVLSGLGGNDYIQGGDSADRIDGGSGDDWLNGGAGANTFVFGRGAGNDYVEASYDGFHWQTIELAEGVALNDLAFALGEDFSVYSSSSALVITIVDSEDTLTVEDFFSDQSFYRLRLADGSTVGVPEIIDALNVPTAGADSLLGDNRTNHFDGGEGDDLIVALGGDDALRGGAGTDVLVGGDGSDVYIFNAGDGQDTIHDDGLGADWDMLWLGAGLTSDLMTLSRGGANDDDLIVSLAGATDKVTIANYFGSPDHRIETIHFADGANLGYAQVMLALLQPTAPQPATFTLFGSITPSGQAYNDGAAVELGVKFSASQAGNVTQLRYFRATGDSNDTDQRQGHLWSSDGALLATVSFNSAPGESGWQVATLSSPVAIQAGTTYVVSYKSADNYFATSNYFTSAFTEPYGVLSAPASGAVGGNGVYAYGSSLQFPTQTFGAANYWVDLVFDPPGGAGGPPVFTSNSSFSLAENSTVVGTVTATDPDANALTYAIAGGADAALFAIDATSGALRFLAAPDFEAPQDTGADNNYAVTVSVTDGNTPAVQQAITVAVADLADTPTGPASFAGSSIQAEYIFGSTANTLFPSAGASQTATVNVAQGAVEFANLPNADPSAIGNGQFGLAAVDLGDQTLQIQFPLDPAVFNQFYVPFASAQERPFNGVRVTDADGQLPMIRGVSIVSQRGFTNAAGADTPLSASDVTVTSEGIFLNVAGKGRQVDADAASAGVQPSQIVLSVDLNDTPVADRETVFTAPNAPIQISASTLLTGDTDADGDALTLSLVRNPVNGTVALDASTSTVVFTPSAGFVGAASFEYVVTDGFGGAATGAVTVHVGAVITGGSGADTLNGGPGDDSIAGLGGGDQLFGDAGDDTFVYFDFSDSSPSAPDVILDFAGAGTAGGDVIDVSALAPGAFVFNGTGGFSGGGVASIRYSSVDGSTALEFDNGNGGAAEMSVWINGAVTFSAQDFIL